MADASTDNKVVALTFDDGPNGAATRAIVDILTREQVPATFFEVGRSVAADPATAAYVASHGFTIGNHSWGHSYLLPIELPHNLREELARTSATIVAATGTAPQYFRPPHGVRSPFLLDEVSDAGMRTVDWSVDPQDYFSNDAKTIASRVVRRVRPGSIILLHDGLQDGPRAKALQARSATMAALPTIIHDLRARGYQFVSLHDLATQPPRCIQILKNGKELWTLAWRIPSLDMHFVTQTDKGGAPTKTMPVPPENSIQLESGGS
jgi:peptidoglycan/xylan/chitin deacetylase (PgdA/CDA1 family)